MIGTDNTIASAAARTPPAAPLAPATSSADFQSFLTLLTAQLRHQDPLSPLDSTQFVAQLASFSTVEELVNANARLDQIASELSGGSIDRYAGWIGREAEAQGAPLLFEGAPTPLRAQADASADRVELVVRDAAGNVVHRAPIANTGEIVIWDGSTANGAASPGAYRASAEYFSDGELTTEKPVSTFSEVVGARLIGEEVRILLASGVELDLSEISGLADFSRFQNF